MKKQLFLIGCWVILISPRPFIRLSSNGLWSGNVIQYTGYTRVNRWVKCKATSLNGRRYWSSANQFVIVANFLGPNDTYFTPYMVGRRLICSIRHYLPSGIRENRSDWRMVTYSYQLPAYDKPYSAIDYVASSTSETDDKRLPDRKQPHFYIGDITGMDWGQITIPLIYTHYSSL